MNKSYRPFIKMETIDKKIQDFRRKKQEKDPFS